MVADRESHKNDLTKYGTKYEYTNNTVTKLCRTEEDKIFIEISLNALDGG